MRAALVLSEYPAAIATVRLCLALVLGTATVTPAMAEAALAVGRAPNGGSYQSWAWNHPTVAGANAAALAGCQHRASNCYIERQFNNLCLAVANGTYGSAWVPGNTIAAARRNTLQYCNRNYGHCRIVSAFCDTVSEAALERQRAEAEERYAREADERDRLAREAATRERQAQLAADRERQARIAADRERARNDLSKETVVQRLWPSEPQGKMNSVLVVLGLLFLTFVIYLATRGETNNPSLRSAAAAPGGSSARAARGTQDLAGVPRDASAISLSGTDSSRPPEGTSNAAGEPLPPPVKAALFQLEGDRPLSPSDQIRTILADVDAQILQPTRSYLKQIDSARADAQRVATQAEEAYRTQSSQLQREFATVRQALEARLQEPCVVEKSVNLPDLSLSLTVPSCWQSAMDGALNLSRINTLWSYYVKAPREAKIASITQAIQVGAGVTAGSLLLWLMSHAQFFVFSGGLGVVILIVAFARQDGHRSDIERDLKNARAATQEALSKIQTVVNEVEAYFASENRAAQSTFNAKMGELRSRAETIIEHYNDYTKATSDYVGRVREELGIPGESLLAAGWRDCRPPDTVISFLRLGEMIPPSVDLDNVLQPTLRLDAVQVPLLLPFAPGRGICIEGDDSAKLNSVPAIQQLAIRLIAGVPPGKLRFTFIDPIGLGQNVALLLALGDELEELVGGKVWSEPTHIEQKLAELTQHMENVIQKYLRDEYASLEDYNVHAGHVVEAYRIVVVCDFPTNFSETSARRLASIAQNGPRCGVYPIVLRNTDTKMPYGVEASVLLGYMSCLRQNERGFEVIDPLFKDWSIALDAAPPADIVKSVIEQHRAGAREGMHVSVPFVEILERTRLLKFPWEGEGRAVTTGGLDVPLGPTGARRYQNFVFGQGTAHHALVIGQTGSGKSNLLHVLIGALTLKYSPEELELYLIDFKQGVEFKLYADLRLPHARVIAIESEREFGLSVLRGLSAEMDRRGEEFRKTGVPNLADWRGRTGQPMPRIVLLIDEFRVLFTAEDSISTEAIRLLDRLVSQGRAFGIHCILASQTLSGSFSLPHSITDQMAVRIVLQCTERDSQLALSDDNREARLLSRPGEAIYNDQRGLVAGNQRFQAADMGNDEARAAVIQTELDNRLAHWQGRRLRPLIFEGHLPARHIDCAALRQWLNQTQWPAAPKVLDMWLGEPISVKPATTVRISRQRGGNLLTIVRDEPLAISLIQSAVLSLAVQLSPEDAAFHVVDMSSVDSPGADSIHSFHSALPHPQEVVNRRGMPAKFQAIHDELQRRIAEDQTTLGSIFLILFGLHRMRDLREDEGAYHDDPSAAIRRQLSAILREGPELGIHTLIWSDTVAAVDRIDRRLINECAKRIVGPMSEQESHRVIDDGAASRLIKPHRLIRFDEDRPGDLEVFRPYAPPVLMPNGTLAEPDSSQPYCPPGGNWFASLADLLSRRRDTGTATKEVS